MKNVIRYVIPFALALVFSIHASATPIVSYDGSSVAVKGSVDGGEAGTVISLVVAKPDSDKNAVSAAAIEAAADAISLSKLVEYIGVVTLDENGMLPNNTKIALNSQLPSGKCAVYMNFLGQNNMLKIGSFMHTNADEVTEIVNLFNNPGQVYADIFDCNNWVTVLKNIGADMESYSQVNNKDALYGMLRQHAPFKATEDESAAGCLIRLFNECCALRRLAESDTDTLECLKQYNTGIWNLELDSESDFSTLSPETQASILSQVAHADYQCASELEKGYLSSVGIAVIREKCRQRSDIKKILESDKYANAFEIDNKPLTDGSLNEYSLINVYNSLINNISNINSADDIKKILNEAIKKELTPPAASSERRTSGGGSRSNVGIVGTVKESSVKGTKAVFRDVDNTHWACGYIQELYTKKIISGRENNFFAPDDYVTREEFVKMLIISLGMQTDTEEYLFADTVKGAWYQPYISVAVSKGFIKGITEDTFGIGKLLTRQDAAVIVDRALADYEAFDNSMHNFADIDDISGYAIDAVSRITLKGLLIGDAEANFKPKANITRAECCAIISRLSQTLGGK